MHVLIVVAHPSPDSLTHAIAAQVARGITDAGPQHSVEIADLAAEGFDPRYTDADLAAFRQPGQVSVDVAAEQARVDRADALVLVYPIYWWSFPALLKGWIDRVFTEGWAYDDGPRGLLGRLRVHSVAIGAADMRTYARHGYFGAMRTQIDHGIFGYCGAQVQSSELFSLAEAGFPQAHFEEAQALGRRIVQKE